MPSSDDLKNMMLIVGALWIAVLAARLRHSRIRIEFLEARLSGDGETMDRMMGITEADKIAFRNSDGSGV